MQKEFLFLCSVFAPLVISVICAHNLYSLARAWFDLKLVVKMSASCLLFCVFHVYFE